MLSIFVVLLPVVLLLFTGILAGLDEENTILLDTPNGQLSFPKKAAATVKPWVWPRWCR